MKLKFNNEKLDGGDCPLKEHPDGSLTCGQNMALIQLDANTFQCIGDGKHTYTLDEDIFMKDKFGRIIRKPKGAEK